MCSIRGPFFLPAPGQRLSHDRFTRPLGVQLERFAHTTAMHGTIIDAPDTKSALVGLDGTAASARARRLRCKPP